MSEFNLSDKILQADYGNFSCIDLVHVKEFIRLLKEELGFDVRDMTEIITVRSVKEIIDKLAGEKLK